MQDKEILHFYFKENQIPTESNINQVVAFYTKCEDSGSSILLYYTKNNGTSYFLAIIYFMFKYKWPLKKSMDYMFERNQNFKIKNNLN